MTLRSSVAVVSYVLAFEWHQERTNHSLENLRRQILLPLKQFIMRGELRGKSTV